MTQEKQRAHALGRDLSEKETLLQSYAQDIRKSEDKFQRQKMIY